MKKSFQLLLLLLVTLFLHNCQDNDLDPQTVPNTESNLNDQIFKSEHFGNATTGNFIGTITDQQGNKLENVQITIGTAITMTDRNGLFILNNVDVFENFAYIKARKDGYINGSRVVIPKATGANKIRIVLLKKETTATVSSGEASQVSLNGTTVNFSGDFIKADGSSYAGSVDVVLHYITPNSFATFTQMPGSLFAQTASNDARNLETYGMVSVNLFSSSGESLNINPESPATIEFPIHYTQTSIAPDTINLWYFDEENGYWKEDGQATKNGNKYVAEVTHFTWWNCDIPFDSVELCFSLLPTNSSEATPFHVIVKRQSNDQLIFAGTVLSREVECGLVPRNEQVTVSIYGINSECDGLLVHTETLGGYATDSSADISFTENFTITSITGTANNCSGNPITNGYVYIDDLHTFSITDGSIDYGYQNCSTETIIIQIFDFDTNQWSIIDNVSIDGTAIDLGTVSTCADSGGIYNGDVILLNQDDVDNFGMLGFNTINGDLRIGNYNETPSNITSLASLAPIENISGRLFISNNELLQSLQGLQNITQVNGTVTIALNPALPSLNGLNGLTTINGLRIASNEMLSSISDLTNITTITGSLIIDNNDALVTLAGFDNITSISIELAIRGNLVLNSINALSNLSSVRSIYFEENAALTNFNGLEQITAVSFMWITNNNALTSLSGLQNIISVDPDYFFPPVLIGNAVDDTGSIYSAPNTNLSDLCALQNLFINGNGSEAQVEIANNAYNPSAQDIIDGNCSQ